MKTIGMVGGTGWVSTAEYYRLLNQFTNEKLGGLQAAKIILYSVNYGEIDKFNRTGNSDEVYRIISLAARSIRKAGADFIMLCANTMHHFAPQIIKDIPLPLIHIGEETAKVITQKNITKVEFALG